MFLIFYAGDVWRDIWRGCPRAMLVRSVCILLLTEATLRYSWWVLQFAFCSFRESQFCSILVTIFSREKNTHTPTGAVDAHFYLVSWP